MTFQPVTVIVNYKVGRLAYEQIFDVATAWPKASLNDVLYQATEGLPNWTSMVITIVRKT